jgi:hypothetical protein
VTAAGTRSACPRHAGEQHAHRAGVRSGERTQQRRGGGRGEHHDEERRAPGHEHGGDRERRRAGVDGEPVPVAERLDDDQRGEQRDGDEVERPAGPRAELPAAREDRPDRLQRVRGRAQASRASTRSSR